MIRYAQAPEWWWMVDDGWWMVGELAMEPNSNGEVS